MERLALVVAVVVAQGHGEASQAAAVAFAKQTGIEQRLDILQRRYLSPEVGRAAVYAKILIDKQITFTWRFP